MKSKSLYYKLPGSSKNKRRNSEMRKFDTCDYKAGKAAAKVFFEQE